MTIRTLFFLTSAFWLTTLGQAEPEPETNAKQIAKAWFVSLIGGETAVTTSLSAVPFSFDRKMVIKDLPGLKKLYDQVVAKKGKRKLAVTSVAIEDSSPGEIVVLLEIEGDDEVIEITVKPGDAFRVIGFSD